MISSSLFIKAKGLNKTYTPLMSINRAPSLFDPIKFLFKIKENLFKNVSFSIKEGERAGLLV